MALVFSKHPIHTKFALLTFGPLKAGFFEITFDNNYPAPGGEAYSVTDFKGFSSIDALFILDTNAGGKIVEHDRVNKKFVVKFFDYNSVAAGAAIEVPNGS